MHVRPPLGQMLLITPGDRGGSVKRLLVRRCGRSISWQSKKSVKEAFDQFVITGL